MDQFHADLDKWQKPNVRVFVIAGYNASTPVKVEEYINSSGYPEEAIWRSFQGDGTVPLKSAETLSMRDGVFADATYYADMYELAADHNKLLKNPDVEKLVYSLLTSGAGVYGNHISEQRPTSFRRSSVFSVHSPVLLSVVDSQGKHTGFLAESFSEAQIPGSAADLFQHVQSVSVSEGDTYAVTIDGLDTGTFTLEQTDVDENGDPMRTITWASVPVSNGSHGTLITSFGATDPVLMVDTHGDGVIDYSLPPDADGDRVPDIIDSCPNTPLGAIVNAHGCSIDQLVPCAGPASGGKWKSHGQYVRSVVKTATAFLKAKLITRRQWMEIVTRAARSKCGWDRRWDRDWDRDWHRDWDCDRDRDWGRNWDDDRNGN
jgi:hypothetical protein